MKLLEENFCNNLNTKYFEKIFVDFVVSGLIENFYSRSLYIYIQQIFITTLLNFENSLALNV